MIHIDHLWNREATPVQELLDIPQETTERVILRLAEIPVHPSRIHQVPRDREVSSTPRDLMEDQRVDLVIDRAKQFIEQPGRAENTWQ
jgi:hypothetical protein